MPRYNKHSDIEKATAIARVIQDSERQVGQWHASGPAVGRRRVRAVQAPAAQRDPQAHDGNGVDEHQQGDVHAHRVVRVGHGYARVKRHFWLQGMWSLPPVARGHARAHESIQGRWRQRDGAIGGMGAGEGARSRNGACLATGNGDGAAEEKDSRRGRSTRHPRTGRERAQRQGQEEKTDVGRR